MAEKRRLPVLNTTKAGAEPDAADDETRPPWHWVFLGVVLTFAAWLPLAWIATAATRSLILPRFGFAGEQSPAELLASLPEAKRAQVGLALAIPQALGAAIAAFGGGFVIARFGKGIRLRETAILGAIVSALAMLPVLGGGGLVVMAVVAFVVLVPCSTLGGFVGLKKRA